MAYICLENLKRIVALDCFPTKRQNAFRYCRANIYHAFSCVTALFSARSGDSSCMPDGVSILQVKLVYTNRMKSVFQKGPSLSIPGS
jgi:hypothetical protein